MRRPYFIKELSQNMILTQSFKERVANLYSLSRLSEAQEQSLERLISLLREEKRSASPLPPDNLIMLDEISAEARELGYQELERGLKEGRDLAQTVSFVEKRVRK